MSLALPAGMAAEVERLALLHALARGAVPLLMVPGAEGPGRCRCPRSTAFPGPAVLCARSGCGALRGPRPVLAVHAEPLGAADRARMWSGVLPGLAQHAPALAARYAVEPALAAEVAGDLAAVESIEARRANLDDVAEACGSAPHRRWPRVCSSSARGRAWRTWSCPRTAWPSCTRRWRG